MAARHCAPAFEMPRRTALGAERALAEQLARESASRLERTSADTTQPPEQWPGCPVATQKPVDG